MDSACREGRCQVRLFHAHRCHLYAPGQMTVYAMCFNRQTAFMVRDRARRSHVCGERASPRAGGRHWLIVVSCPHLDEQELNMTNLGHHRTTASRASSFQTVSPARHPHAGLEHGMAFVCIDRNSLPFRPNLSLLADLYECQFTFNNVLVGWFSWLVADRPHHAHTGVSDGAGKCLLTATGSTVHGWWWW